MKTKHQKRVEARARFSILTFPAWCAFNHGKLPFNDEHRVALYNSYRERKRIERIALDNSIKKGN